MFKGVTETIKSETKEQKGGFLRTMVGTLASILLGSLLSGKEIVRACSENKKEKELEGLVTEIKWVFIKASSFN